MRRVLLVTYFYPPDPGVGGLRARGLARYLSEHGWEVVVLAAGRPEPADDGGVRVVRAHDPGELSVLIKAGLGLDVSRSFQEQLGVPASVRARQGSWGDRMFGLLKGLVVYPDDARPWLPFAVAAGEALLADGPFDAILSSSSPPTVHEVARRLRARFGVPWAADFRDPWTQNHAYPYGPLRRAVERRLERRTIRDADALLTVSEPFAALLERLHGRPVAVAENGFDPLERTTGDRPLTDAFTLTYTGRLYAGAQDPGPLLDALRRLAGAGRIDLDRVRLRFYGPPATWLASEAARRGLGGVVEEAGVVARDEALVRQRESQLLVLFDWRDRRSGGIYPAKVFEYLAAGRPVLGVGVPWGSVVERLLERTGAGVYCRDDEALDAALLEAWAAYAETGRVPDRSRPAEVERYSQRAMARRVAAVLDDVVNRAR